MPKKLCVVPSSNSLFGRKLLSAENGGFTKYARADYWKWKLENRIIPDGVNAKLLGCRGRLSNRRPGQAFVKPAHDILQLK